MSSSLTCPFSWRGPLSTDIVLELVSSLPAKNSRVVPVALAGNGIFAIQKIVQECFVRLYAFTVFSDEANVSNEAGRAAYFFVPVKKSTFFRASR